MDSLVWMPYGDSVHEDPERLRYMDSILGFAKKRLIDAIERFRVEKGGLPAHLEHVRPKHNVTMTLAWLGIDPAMGLPGSIHGSSATSPGAQEPVGA